MPRWLKVCLWIIGIIVYLNIGYLVAYSLDNTANQTAFSNVIYGAIDFTGYMGRVKVKTDMNGEAFAYYAVFTLLWPIVVSTSWVANFISLFWSLFWTIFVWFRTIFIWLVTGGMWRWLKLI